MPGSPGGALPIHARRAGATLKYSVPSTTILTVDLARMAYNNYLTEGILEVGGLKLSELAGIAASGGGDKKGLRATASVAGDVQELTVPKNAVLTSDGGALGTVTKLIVEGELNTGDVEPVLANVESLTVNGKLRSKAKFPEIADLTVGLKGSLSGVEADFAATETLTVKGELNLPLATFAKLKTLTFEPKASLTTAVAFFPLLETLTMAEGSVFEVGASIPARLNLRIWAHSHLRREPGYPLQFLDPLWGSAGFPLLSLALCQALRFPAGKQSRTFIIVGILVVLQYSRNLRSLM